MSWQTGTSSEKTERQKQEQKRSTCSERITKLALPSFHIVTSVLREHFKKLSREQIARLEKLLRQIQGLRKKNDREQLIKTLDDLEPTEKEKIWEIIGDQKDFEARPPPVKSASDTFLIDPDKKLKFLYRTDDKKKWECRSSENFLSVRSSLLSQKTHEPKSDAKRKNSQCERDRKKRNKKSTVTIYTQYSDQSVTSYNTAPSKSLLLEEELDTKVLFVKQTWKADVIEHVRGDYARIRRRVRYRRREPPVFYCRRLARIVRNVYYIVTCEIAEALTKYLQQICNVDNYVYYCAQLPVASCSKLKPLITNVIQNVSAAVENPRHFELAAHIESVRSFLAYLIPPVLLRSLAIVVQCFCRLMFCYDEEDLIELSGEDLKILKAKCRRRYHCCVLVENVSSILQ